MKVKLGAAMLLLVALHTAAAQSRLQLKTFTAAPEGFSVNSVLVYGAKDAVVIDAQFTESDARRLVAVLKESKKNLTTVYVTHAHPDHYFGFGAIKQAFPNAKIVALPGVVKDIQASAAAKVRQWKPQYGDNITADPVIPEPLDGTSFKLEGETLQVIGGVQGDATNSSYVWIGSLQAAVVGDIAFAGVYPWTAETTPALRQEWIRTLDQIIARKPNIVVAGHKQAGTKDDASSLEFTRDYLSYFDQALAESRNADELVKKVTAKYPNLGLDVILKIGAEAAFAQKQ